MSAGMSTINTVLKAGATASALTQLCKIKSYPQLGGERETIETTDLEDNAQTFVPGVQSVSAMIVLYLVLMRLLQALKKQNLNPVI